MIINVNVSIKYYVNTLFCVIFNIKEASITYKLKYISLECFSFDFIQKHNSNSCVMMVLGLS